VASQPPPSFSTIHPASSIPHAFLLWRVGVSCPSLHHHTNTATMGKDTRVTYQRRHAYATRSNERVIVKTPGMLLAAVVTLPPPPSLPPSSYHQPHTHIHLLTPLPSYFYLSGGRLTLHQIKKKTRGPRCGDCKISLPGIKHLKTKVRRRCGWGRWCCCVSWMWRLSLLPVLLRLWILLQRRPSAGLRLSYGASSQAVIIF